MWLGGYTSDGYVNTVVTSSSLTLPRNRLLERNLVRPWILSGFETKMDYSGEDHKEFTGPTDPLTSWATISFPQNNSSEISWKTAGGNMCGELEMMQAMLQCLHRHLDQRLRQMLFPEVGSFLRLQLDLCGRQTRGFRSSSDDVAEDCTACGNTAPAYWGVTIFCS
jgi:hypothetical protein